MKITIIAKFSLTWWLRAENVFALYIVPETIWMSPRKDKIISHNTVPNTAYSKAERT